MVTLLRICRPQYGNTLEQSEELNMVTLLTICRPLDVTLLNNLHTSRCYTFEQSAHLNILKSLTILNNLQTSIIYTLEQSSDLKMLQCYTLKQET